MMYKALRQLRGHLDSLLLSQAWPSINWYTLVVVIVTTVYNHCLLLLHGYDATEQKPVCFMPGETVLQTCGAGPYILDLPNRSVDQYLTD